MLQIYLFGALRLVADGAPQVWRAPPKTLPLFAYLLLHRRQTLKRQRLAFTFWPDESEDAARSNLRRHLHDLRRALPAPPPTTPWLLTEADAVQWNPSAPFWLDVAEFECLSAAPATLAAAVPLYTGDLLPELYDDWIFFERERLQERFFTILAQLAARNEAQGDYQAAIGYAGHILRRDPLREETSRWLMALHYRAGDRNAALQEYRRLERCLQTELDLPPLPETKALYEAIASGETLTGTRAGESEQAWSPPHNLPAQVAAFVGREEELTALEALLDPAHGRPPLPPPHPHRGRRQQQDYHEMDKRRGICLCLAGLAGVAAETGRPELAARLLAAVSVHLTPMGAHLMGPADQAEYDWHLATVRAALPQVIFEADWEAGREWTFELALAAGLEV